MSDRVDHSKPGLGDPERRRRPGRPAAGRDVRAALLESARRCFSAEPYTSVTLRQIATLVGVNPAMVAYYFGSKLGLYEAMLDGAVATIGAALAELTRAPEPDIERFLSTYMETLGEYPWLPPLLARDVFGAEGPMRDVFVRRLAERGAVRLPAALRRLQLKGRLRPGLDPSLTMLNLISLGLLPFLARPVAETVLGVRYDSIGRRRLIANTLAVLRTGMIVDGK